MGYGRCRRRGFHRRWPAGDGWRSPALGVPGGPNRKPSLSLHCEDLDLAGSGSMNEGEVSAQLGLAGIPGAAESAAIAGTWKSPPTKGRGCISPMSVAPGHWRRSRRLRKAGAAVTCEAAPHHLVLVDEAVRKPRLQLQDEPAAPRRRRPASPGGGAGRRSDGLYRHRPRSPTRHRKRRRRSKRRPSA